MKHMIEPKELNNVFQLLAEKKRIEAEIEKAFAPKISDLSKMQEVSDFIDEASEEPWSSENWYDRKNMKRAIIFFIFCPEYFYRTTRVVRGKKSVTATISKVLGISYTAIFFSRQRLSRYAKYGHFADKVDIVYQRVREHFDLE